MLDITTCSPHETVAATHDRSRPRVAPGWRAAQIACLIAGAAILSMLVLWPRAGLHAFWNVLVPIAPAIVAVAPGVWRNVCPLATAALLPRHLGSSRRLRIPRRWQGRLALAGVILLLAIVPLRHAILDLDGRATAAVLAALAVLAMTCGLLWEWKSGWCSGACPVHAVERLYGIEPALTVPNAHCGPCECCVAPCPDSAGAAALAAPARGRPFCARDVAVTLLAGGFPGFIWGWFHVANLPRLEGAGWIAAVYGPPAAGFLATLLPYLLLRRWVSRRGERLLARVFAAAAIICYYWYRLPALIGLGLFPGDGALVDLSGAAPPWTVPVLRASTTALLAWWLLARRRGGAWMARPPLAPRIGAAGAAPRVRLQR